MRRPLLPLMMALATALATALTVALNAVGPLASTAAATGQPGAAFPPIWDKGPGGERYVAFGDSFAAGPLVGEHRPNDGGCLRSTTNYASLVATQLAVTSFVDASCSGAQTKDLAAPQVLASISNAPQLDALSADTTLVTFGTLGGNDVGLVQMAFGCLFGNCVPAAGTDPNAAAFAQLRRDLVTGITATRRRAPRAEIVVVGYGTYLPRGGCPTKILGFSGPEANYVQSQIDRLSDTLKAAAAETGVHFADMRLVPGAIDHTACAAPGQQWLRAIETYGDGILMHPSTKGMQAWGDHLSAVVLQVLGERDGVPVGDLTPGQTARLAALKAKGQAVRAGVKCYGFGSLTLLSQRVIGDERAISKVGFWVGEKKLGDDQEAEFGRVDLARSVRRHPGSLKAVVHVRDGALRWVRTIDLGRPSCLR